MNTHEKRLGLFALGAMLIGALGAGIGWAAIPAADGVYTACVSAPVQSGTYKGVAAVGLLDTAVKATCPSGATQVTWNKEGQPGPAGPAGPKGDQGPPGAGVFYSSRITNWPLRTSPFSGGSTGDGAVLGVSEAGSSTRSQLLSPQVPLTARNLVVQATAVPKTVAGSNARVGVTLLVGERTFTNFRCVLDGTASCSGGAETVGIPAGSKLEFSIVSFDGDVNGSYDFMISWEAS